MIMSPTPNSVGAKLSLKHNQFNKPMLHNRTRPETSKGFHETQPALLKQGSLNRFKDRTTLKN